MKSLFISLLLSLLLLIVWQVLKLPHDMNGPEKKDYEILEAHQLGGLIEDYNHQVYDLYDSMFFDATKWISIIVNNEKIKEHLTPEQVKRLYNLISTGKYGLSSKRARQAANSGTQLFESFHGQWEGKWHQDDDELDVFHHWHSPENLSKYDNIIVQAVFMGKPVIGKARTVAINSLSKTSGIILGAVGIKEGLVQRPHIGFYVDSNTLIWIALERSFGEEREYSLFYEWVFNNGTDYHIEGFDFFWNRHEKTLTLNRHKYGRYKRVLPTLASSLPMRFPGVLDQTKTTSKPFLR